MKKRETKKKNIKKNKEKWVENSKEGMNVFQKKNKPEIKAKKKMEGNSITKARTKEEK